MSKRMKQLLIDTKQGDIKNSPLGNRAVSALAAAARFLV